MTYDEVYELIHLKYRFVQRPTNEELQKVVNEIVKLSKIKSDLDDGDLAKIIDRNIKIVKSMPLKALIYRRYN